MAAKPADSSAVGLLIDHIDTPLGRFAVVTDHSGYLHATGWTDNNPHFERLLSAAGEQLEPSANPGGYSAAVRAYFSGKLDAFADLKIAAAIPGTTFQTEVWAALRTIPSGQTRSYGQLAKQIGRPKAVRAVGAANGKNPCGLVVPCHRVIGADGSLTGFGAGIERKRWLLTHERQFGA